MDRGEVGMWQLRGCRFIQQVNQARLDRGHPGLVRLEWRIGYKLGGKGRGTTREGAGGKDWDERHGRA